jgi:hypothetical protein
VQVKKLVILSPRELLREVLALGLTNQGLVILRDRREDKVLVLSLKQIEELPEQDDARVMLLSYIRSF